jgi:hypothetical protein
MNQEPPTISGASNSKKFFLWTILFLVGAIITGVAGFKYWLSIPPREVVEADAGFKKAEKTINPEQLRAWALDEIQKYSVTNGANLPNSEIPDYIQNLYSVPVEDFSVFPKTSEREGSVTICWGGGFFHWMIDIGPTNDIETTGATNNFTIVEWVPGIYYSREDTRHPFK